MFAVRIYIVADVGGEYYDERHRRLVSHSNRVPAAIPDFGYQGRATGSETARGSDRFAGTPINFPGW